MDAERVGERQRAGAARTRSAVLRARAEDLRRRALSQTDRSVRTLQREDGLAFGERDGSLSFRLPALPVVLGLVRHELRRWLQREGVPADAAADVTLACSEACANAIEHPRAAERLRFEVTARLLGGRVEIVVEDFGSWESDGGGGEETRGRGLDMIGQLMDDVSIADDGCGTRVTMRRRVDPTG